MKQIFRLKIMILGLLIGIMVLGYGGSCRNSVKGKDTDAGSSAPPTSGWLTNADLSSLTLSAKTLNPPFSSGVTSYTAMFITETSITVTPTVAEPGATITVNGSPVPSDQPSNPISLNLGPNTITIIVTALDNVTTKTYTITANKFDQQYQYQEAYIKASNTETNDQFGLSVAISGDTLVVGAYLEASNATGVNGNQADNSAVQSGAVYVFIRTGSTWTQQAYIKASNTEANDFFGGSVAISGDTLVVGAIGEANLSGAVYIFTRTGTNWSQQAYIKGSNTEGGDLFGRSVAISGDTLVVGANGESSDATGINGDQSNNRAIVSGAVYVFTRTGTDWTQQAYIKASNNETIEPSYPEEYGDGFGLSVAISGDTLVVGAPWEDSNATGVNGDQSDNSANESGAVYVFIRTGTDWIQQAYIKASNTEAGDMFGDSVAISGDTLVVRAGESSNATGINGDQSNNSASGSGAVYVFTRTGTDWIQQAYIKASNTGAGDGFGSVAISGDTLVVGAAGEDSNATGVNGNQADNNASRSGAVYVFTRTGTDWTQQAYIKASNTGAGDGFGGSVAISGDTLVVGAAGEASNATGVNGNQADNSAADSGAVYVFR